MRVKVYIYADERGRPSAGRPRTAGLGTSSAAGCGGARTPGTGLGEQIVPIQAHHLVPGRHEVAHELLLRVVAGVDLGQGPQLGVRAEDEVGGGGGPLGFAGGTIAPLVDVLVCSR